MRRRPLDRQPERAGRGDIGESLLLRGDDLAEPGAIGDQFRDLPAR